MSAARLIYSALESPFDNLGRRLTATGMQECFEGEAEVIQGPQKDATLHFEEEDTCVQPSKPDFDDEAGLDFDSASEGDPEAASLAGSVCPCPLYISAVPTVSIQRCHAC